MVKEAFDLGIIDPAWLEYSDFEEDLEYAIRNPSEPWQKWVGNFAPFGSTVEELSCWYCFSDQYKEERARARARTRDRALLPYLLDAPIRNPLRGIGRNDPCPCGSGKKYKKCCLQ
jgi:hypothetical protein